MLINILPPIILFLPPITSNLFFSSQKTSRNAYVLSQLSQISFGNETYQSGIGIPIRSPNLFSDDLHDNGAIVTFLLSHIMTSRQLSSKLTTLSFLKPPFGSNDTTISYFLNFSSQPSISKYQISSGLYIEHCSVLYSQNIKYVQSISEKIFY